MLLLPTVLAVIQNPRIDNPPQGWGALLYGNEQRYVHILQCLFFPPDIPARPNFTPDSNAKWASLGAWLPLFSMSGVIAWLQTQKRDWLKRLLIILFFMAMVPILNSAFQLFNSSYYARWFYMLTLMMSLATVRSLESVQVDWKRSIKWTMGITAAIAIPIAFIPQEISNDDGTTTTRFGLMQYPDRFWIYVAIAFASLLLLIIALRFLKRDRKMFYRVTMVSVSVITVIYAAYLIGLGKAQSYDTHNFIIPYSLNQGEDIDLPDSDVESRIDIYEGMDNQAMFWQMPTIQAFHSIVPGSIMEFYPSIGVTRDVGSRPETDVYGLRALTSTRWLFDYTGDTEEFESSTNSSDTKMPGWSFYDTQNGFDIWENRYFIPYGFTYDQYMTREQYDNIAESSRHLALLKAIVLEDDAVERNKDILTQAPTDSFRYGEADYYQDCLNRKSDTCSTFTRDNYGFTATYTAGAQDELVFFSVPWEAGWSATVNGEEAIIEKVNVGFMAVRVPANTESTIRFNYTTPGLKAGALITVGFLLLFVAYLILMRKWDQKHPKLHRKTYRIK